MQILRQKVHEWNLLAHKLNNFKDIECEIAEIIQSWMQMELQCWRQSLDQTFEGAKGKAYRYWFFLYNLVHEFLRQDKNDEEKTKKISTVALTKVLNQFIESSTFAEFKLRLRLLKAFQTYVGKLAQDVEEKSQVISILHNIHSYFSQFSEKVQDQIDTVRSPIENNLRKLVKIHSFNKDLSYFSTESNIKQVHRNLHKYLKEFDVEISKKVINLFIYQDQSFELNTSNFTKKINTLNVETFIISIESSPTSDENTPPFVQDAIKYIPKSRGLIKKSLNNIQYPSLIESLEEMIENELERCNHLRSQKVDETLPRNKQKSQAKSILNQKRKALSEFFKAMTSLGMNYRTGLLTSSLNPELIDFQVSPYAIKKLKITDDDGKADLYFNKSIFKMKLLMNSLLSPRADMDRTFLERIKGFAVNLFSLAQNQRMELSKNANELVKLQHYLRDVEIVMNSKIENFEKEARKFKIIQESFLHAIKTFDQFKLLMKCAPESDVCGDLKAITSSNNTLHQKSKIYKDIMAAIDSCSQELKIITEESRFVVSGEEMIDKLKCIIGKLNGLKNLFSIDNECSIYGLPILDLYNKLNENLHQIEQISNESCDESINNINDDLSRLSHTILISIQNIYKQYRDEEKQDNEEIKNVLENQLKEHLHLKLAQDIQTLGLKNVNSTLKIITNSLFNYCDEKSIQMLKTAYPLLKQFMLLVDFFLIQQINAQRLTSKMLSIMLSVFIELSKNGFCVPEHLLSDEEQKEEMDQKPGEGFGFEDGQGEKDVSDKLESEDQLDEAKRAEDYKKENKEEQQDCKEEKGIDMSENFEGKMHDVDNDDEDDDKDPNENDKEEIEKEMGETSDDADKLDDQIWGSDDENEQEEEEEGKNEEDGKGSGDKDDKHNDLDTTENETNTQEQEEQGDGLDAATEMEDKRKKSKNDIDKMNEEGNEEEVDQTNPYHNELEEPPEPEDLNLDDNVDLDNQEKEEKDLNNDENPFDIDKMKNGMDDEEMGSDSEDPAKEKEQSEELSEADEENQKVDENQENNDGDEKMDTENEDEPVKQPDAINPEEKEEDGINPDDNKHSEIPNDYHESKDKQSKEENIESMPSQNDKGSHDQVQTESSEEVKQDQDNMEIDDQDTGEDKDGTGQAENKESKSGHQGIANQKEAPSQRNRNDNDKQQKRKKGNTDQERTLGDVDRLDKKFLKTVDKLNRENDQNETENKSDEEETDEYQHVKDAKKSDKSTLDNATQEQSKKIQHEDDAKNLENEDDNEVSFYIFLIVFNFNFK